MLLVAGRVPVEIVRAPGLKNRNDVLFYFIGAGDVPDDRFVPGAVGNRLTSTGGDLLGHSQMSSLRWLEGGAVGSWSNSATRRPSSPTSAL